MMVLDLYRCVILLTFGVFLVLDLMMFANYMRVTSCFFLQCVSFVSAKI